MAIRFSPTYFRVWRVYLYKLFGARITGKVNIYPSVYVWAPWNLTIGNGSCLAPNVNVYNQGKITIKDDVLVSQGAHLCASTHDYDDPLFQLVLAPITIESHCWVCAEAFIGPGVHLGEGCVVGARAVVVTATDSWSIYGGNPAKKLKGRVRS